MKIASFYTNRKYQAECRNLAASAQEFGIEGLSYSMPDTGTWTGNVNHKPSVILRALEETKEDIFYVDADARIVAPPDYLSRLSRDVAAYHDTPLRPCGGTLFFRNKPSTIELVQAWVEEVAKRPDSADDWVNLPAALKRFPGMKLDHLPPAYNWSEQFMRDRFPGARPVVVHRCIGEHNYADYGQG